MRLRPPRRNLVILRQSAGSAGRYRSAPTTRPTCASRIRRLTRVGVLLILVLLARGGRAHWVLAGVVLTAAGPGGGERDLRSPDELTAQAR